MILKWTPLCRVSRSVFQILGVRWSRISWCLMTVRRKYFTSLRVWLLPHNFHHFVLAVLKSHQKISARDLSVVIDEHATMSQHVSSVCRSASFALYNIGKLRTYLDKASTEMLVHTFVSSRLDSCNRLLYGLPQNELERLQRVQNAPARLVSGVKGRIHMTPVLRKLP